MFTQLVRQGFPGAVDLDARILLDDLSGHASHDPLADVEGNDFELGIGVAELGVSPGGERQMGAADPVSER